MSKLIFDLDGVIITYRKNFAESYSSEFDVDIGEIYSFFSTDYHDCATGQASLRDRIERYIEPWRWPGGAESLIQYFFDCQSTLDTDLLELIGAARQAGHECYIASDQDSLRSDYLRNLIDFEADFDDCFFSYQIGATKNQAAFFDHILRELACPSHEIYFWDDNPKNVNTAKLKNIQANLYTDYETFSHSFERNFLLP